MATKTFIRDAGSVGMPLDGDPRAANVLLEFESDQCESTIHRVTNDREAVITELKG